MCHQQLAQAWAHLLEAAKAARLEGVDETTARDIEREAEFVKVVDWIRFDLEWDFHHSPHLERLDPDALGAWVRVVEHLSIFMVDDCARRALLKTVRPLRIADGALIVQPLDAVTAATLARYQAGIERYIIPTRELQAGLPPYNRLRIED